MCWINDPPPDAFYFFGHKMWEEILIIIESRGEGVGRGGGVGGGQEDWRELWAQTIR
jgi:hypothetical protein